MIYNDDCMNVLSALPTSAKYCIVTDPPFNVGYHYNEYKDKKDENDYYKWIKKVFESLNCPFVVIHYPENLHRLTLELGYCPEKCISWIYNSNNKKQHRDICFYKIAPDLSKVKQPYKNLKDKRILERISNGSKGADIYDWWYVDMVKNVSEDKTEHPCQMPAEIMMNIIKCLPEDLIIVDPFMGSGTTGVACDNLKREFIGIEIDKKYFEIAKNRLNHNNYQLTMEI